MKSKLSERTTRTAATTVENHLPSFKNPPVSEVACGILFSRLENFTTAHGGAFWTRIRNDFPQTEHAPPIVTPSAMSIDQALGFPLPRQWFISKDKQGLLQLQGDCLFYNWRRLNDSDVYPRFETVLDCFQRYLGEFINFLAESGLPSLTITGCELTYVNQIPQEHGWKSQADLGKVFRDMYWSPSQHEFLPTPKETGWQMEFPLPTEGTLTASLISARRVRDNVPTLKLDMSAKVNGEARPLENVWAWLDEAHEWIVRGFADLTQADFQREAWKRTR